MLFDNNMFSEAQAVTATAASTNSWDFGANGTPVGSLGPVVGDLGKSDIDVMVQVVEAFNNLTTLKVGVEMDDNSSFSSATTVASSETVALASLVAGYKFKIPCEIPEGTTERYVRLKYTVAGTAPTTGKITAGIVAARG